MCGSCPKYIASCSFGKDSLATIIIARQKNEPLHGAVYCEVMFDEQTSGEIPEHREFIYNVAVPKLQSWGIKTIVLKSEKNYVWDFKRVIQKGKGCGKINSFPLCGKCCIQRDCKVPPIENYKRSLPGNTVQYIGYAKDETERLLRLQEGTSVSLLEKYGINESDAFEICRSGGLLSPIYEFTNRGGCWFCPNAKQKELRHLYDYHPDLWAKMLELQALPNKATEYFNRNMRFSDIDYNFRMDDTQTSLFEEE